MKTVLTIMLLMFLVSDFNSCKPSSLTVRERMRVGARAHELDGCWVGFLGPRSRTFPPIDSISSNPIFQVQAIHDQTDFTLRLTLLSGDALWNKGIGEIVGRDTVRLIWRIPHLAMTASFPLADTLSGILRILDWPMGIERYAKMKLVRFPCSQATG